ncbi:MAG: TRAM domain-containing protein, partial [Deltaproteobacteria bacterium]|nr:TRAM domain-containing protein [Deltaproteobacteria bacterium]
HMKRSRGRRGLDILNRMQKNDGIKIEVVDIDFPKIKGVDSKLVALAKEKGGTIVTNDYNLNKVAELQGIKILNINELANALKPLVLPGEAMTVRVIKEGKEAGQGLAYLDDGTMVVVDNGTRYMGKSVEVVVTSVLQTAAGRMIFSGMKDDERSGASTSK